jgi:hypothetical protein
MMNVKRGLLLSVIGIFSFTIGYSMTKEKLSDSMMDAAMFALCTGVHASGEKCPDTDACKSHYGNGVCKYWAETNNQGEITSQGCACYKGGTMAEDEELEFKF